MSQQGKSEEEIISRVKQTLSRIRHERSSQPVEDSRGFEQDGPGFSAFYLAGPGRGLL